MTTNDGTVGRYLGWFLVALSLGAGAIHVAFTGTYFDVGFAQGLFFAVVAWAQVAWAAAIIVRPTRNLLVLGAIGNTAVLGVWFVSRVWGIPIGPDAWTPEPVAFADALCSAFEAMIVLLSVGILVRPALAQRSIKPRLGFSGVGLSAVAIGVVSTVALSPSFASGHTPGTAGNSQGTATVEAAAGHVHAHTGAGAGGHTEGHTDVVIAADGTSNCEQSGYGNGGNSGHGHRGPVAPVAMSPATRDKFRKQMTASDEVVAKYPTAADAEAAGYHAITPYVPCIAAHFLKQSALGNGFDPTEPEILLYDGTDPKSHIVGLSYLVFGDEDKAPTGFAGEMDHWHVHRQLCIGRGIGVLGDENTTAADCEARGGRVVPLTNLWMTHEWNAPGWDSYWGLFSSENPWLGGRIGDINGKPRSYGQKDQGKDSKDSSETASGG
jgi:hypothetical protein